MTDPRIESLKRMNLAEFLTRYYGLEFELRGGTYRCCSPFTNDRRPSFFVRLVAGHWLFKDYSSGAGGSIFDFVQMKEKLPGFRETKDFICRLLRLPSGWLGQAVCLPCIGSGEEGVSMDTTSYDVNSLYDRFRNEDPKACRDYLLERRISPDLVNGLIDEGTVVHNRYQGRSYCCFAVRDDRGELKCLDNHAIEGSGKFVLGTKSPFSCEWGAISRAKVVFVSEGIIDYLSVKSLELAAPPGLALLGNQLCFEPALLEKAETLVSAMDDDRAGDSAVLDLKERYPDKEVCVYDLEGHKDPNELLLAVRTGKGRTLSPERKLQLYREFHAASNKTELAERWGIDRSHLYEIVRECEALILEGFCGRKRGRPRKGAPTTLKQALARIEELEREYERKATAYEEQYCRGEFLALRLKWAQTETAELRGEAADEAKGPPTKPQLKKKRRKRRSKP